MQKKKVLLVSSSFYPSVGGVENSLRSLAECLNDKSIDVYVVASNKGLNKGKRLAKKETVFGAKVFRYHFLPFFLHFFSSMLLLLKLKRKYKFDVVISRSHVTTLLALILGFNNLKYIAPAVYQFQKKSLSYSFLEKIRFKLNKELEKVVLRKLDVVYVFSDNMISQIKKVNNSVNVIKVPPGIDVYRFSHFEKDNVRSDIGVKDDDVLLLFLGRVEEVKQPLKAIECLKYLPCNYKLLFVGDGKEMSSCKRLVEEMNLRDRIIFKGFTDFPESYYSASDIFLMTSSYESFGQVLLEALASGLPIVAFDPVKAKVNTATKELSETIDVENAFEFSNENTSLSLAKSCLLVRKLTGDDIRKINLKLLENWSWFNVFESVERNHASRK